MIYKTTGIILKRTNFREADRIITIYTKDHGKVRIIAKGVRKILSKLAGHLELFCVSNLMLAEGRNLDVLTGAEVKKCFFNLRQDLKATRSAYYIAEIIDRLTEEEEKHPQIYSLLEEVLENLDTYDDKLTLAYFEINFLVETGFKPELYHCLVCKDKIISNHNYFDFDAGGLVCDKCHKDGMKISDEAIKLMRLLITKKLNHNKKIKATQKIITEVEKLTRNYLNYTAKHDFKSQKYLEVK